MAEANLAAIALMLREAVTEAGNMSGPAAQRQTASHHLLRLLGLVEQKLNTARGAGFVSNRMDSTLILLREIRDKEQAIYKLAEEQRARMASLHAGIEAMLG